MRNLNYELMHLCLRHRDGSHATRYDRERILTLMADQLYEQGFRYLQAKNLNPEHVKTLLTLWKAEGLSAGAIKNRLCVIRWWAAKIRKPNVVARSNDAYGIGSRNHVAHVSKARALSAEELNRITDPYSTLSPCLQAVSGLRRGESIKVQPAWADRGNKLVPINTWCMGRRGSEIAIRTDLQRTVLNEAKKLAGKGSLIPKEMSYVEQLQRFKAQCMKAHIHGVHGYRQAYAKQRYKELTGRNCPAAGGKPATRFSAKEKVLDREARLIISRELGDKRVEETLAYLGR
jgi:Phage integrase, N-terminal/Integrase